MISTPITSPPSLGPKERDDTLPWSDLMVGNVRGNAGLLPSTRHGELKNQENGQSRMNVNTAADIFRVPFLVAMGSLCDAG